MEATNVCVYAKFGRCKREDCQFHHPEVTCCDKSCDINSCLKKHPQYCRYFWGFRACRNEESCKFLHNKEASNFIDIDMYRDLEQKYNDILEKYNDVVRRVESLENVNKPCTRSRSALSRSRGDVKRKLDNSKDTLVDNDKKVKHGGDIDTTNVSINKDETKETIIVKYQSTSNNNFDSSTMIYVKDEAIKLKSFVHNVKMVNDGRSECKRKIQNFRNKLKQSTNKRDHGLDGFFRIIGTNIQNLPNSNFKTSAMKEIETIVGMTNNLIVSDRMDKEHEILRKNKIEFK